MNNDALTSRVATKAFFQALRREWARRNPNDECPVPSLDTMDGNAKASFIRCMTVALTAADPVNVDRVRNEEILRDS